MTTICMWLMFTHGLTVGACAVMAWLNSGFLRWWMLSLAAMAIFNAVTLKVHAQVPRDPRPMPWPERPVPAMVEV